MQAINGEEDALDLLPFLLLFIGSWGIVNQSTSSAQEAGFNTSKLPNP